MKLFFTVDLEDWFCAHDYAVPQSMWDEIEHKTKENTYALLKLLDRYGIKAIFFTLGYIAERYPDLIREVQSRGHLIGSHGYNHEKLYAVNRETVQQDISRSVQLLESITGEKVRHYRAPSWTFDERSAYLYEILEDLGVTVDSSLQPFKTPLSGVRGAESKPHHPNRQGKRLSIVEFPVPLCQVGPFKFPFCGGFYLRVLPFWFTRICLLKTLKRQDCFVYIHPWEIDPNQPKWDAPLHLRFTHTYGIQKIVTKLEMLFQEFRFADPAEFGEERSTLKREETL